MSSSVIFILITPARPGDSPSLERRFTSIPVGPSTSLIPPFVPPELQIESWHESIAKIRELNPTNLYLPHFGSVKGSVAAHLDALDERVTRWSEWFREKISAGFREPDLVAAFAKLEHDDLIASGATEELARDYETVDPSYMAVPGAIRYWQKYHPGEVFANNR